MIDMYEKWVESAQKWSKTKNKEQKENWQAVRKIGSQIAAENENRIHRIKLFYNLHTCIIRFNSVSPRDHYIIVNIMQPLSMLLEAHASLVTSACIYCTIVCVFGVDVSVHVCKFSDSDFCIHFTYFFSSIIFCLGLVFTILYSNIHHTRPVYTLIYVASMLCNV